MATKVFLKWFGTNGENGLTTGREYEFVEWHVVNDSGTTLYTSGLEPHWQRIERQTFEANGFQWFAHEPGDAMPCDGDAKIVALYRDGYITKPWSACNYRWHPASAKEDPACDIIGWRYADSAKPEVPQNIARGPKIIGVDFAEDESERNDLIAAVDDGHLTPGQKAYIQAKEDAQAAKQQLAKDAQDKALQERAEQLSDAGKAMDRIDQDHGHRLGWMA